MQTISIAVIVARRLYVSPNFIWDRCILKCHKKNNQPRIQPSLGHIFSHGYYYFRGVITYNTYPAACRVSRGQFFHWRAPAPGKQHVLPHWGPGCRVLFIDILYRMSIYYVEFHHSGPGSRVNNIGLNSLDYLPVRRAMIK